MYRLSKLVLIFALCAPLSGCCCSSIFGSTDEGSSEFMFLGHRQPSRDAAYPELELCLKSRDGDVFDPPRHVSRFFVQRFKPEWGYEYRVRATLHRRNVDGHMAHHLNEIIERRSVAGQTFEMDKMGAPWLEAGEAPRALMDGTQFACGPDACEALDARLKEGPKARFKMVLRHEASGAPLTLLGVE